jgi:hypothetical protein
VYSIDSVNVENHKSSLNLPEDVLFGTLWVGSSTAEINSINSVQGELPGSRKLESLREMLANNTGKRVRLILAYQDPEEAVVENVLNNVAVFKTKDRWITTTIEKIETIEFLDAPVLTAKEKGQVLQIEWNEKATGRQSISVVYMRNKLGWVPEYFVILGNDNMATISLRAKLVNDAEDIKNAGINFVAGVPNFKYGNVTDPLSSKEEFGKFMWEFGDQKPDFQYGLFENRKPMNKGTYRVEIAPDGATVFAEGEASEDFYYYTVKNLTLPKGGRATYPLLDGRVNVKHLYAADLPANGEYYLIRSENSKTDERVTTVYHSIELTNSTGQPWTSGSAFVVKDGGGETEPMAQDLMPYTSAGNTAEVQITSSPEIRVTDMEEEKDREEDAKEQDKISYDMITVEGKIDVQNNKDEALTLDIRRPITGTLIRSDLQWTFTKDVTMHSALNPQNQVKWEVPLKAAEKKTITYRYKILVPKQ